MWLPLIAPTGLVITRTWSDYSVSLQGHRPRSLADHGCCVCPIYAYSHHLHHHHSHPCLISPLGDPPECCGRWSGFAHRSHTRGSTVKHTNQVSVLQKRGHIARRPHMHVPEQVRGLCTWHPSGIKGWTGGTAPARGAVLGAADSISGRDLQGLGAVLHPASPSETQWDW